MTEAESISAAHLAVLLVPLAEGEPIPDELPPLRALAEWRALRDA